MTLRYFARRYALWQSNDASLDELIREDRSLVTWENPSDLPAIRVTFQLSCALECLYAGDKRRGEIFLNRAARNADRLIAEKRYLDTKVAEAGYPRNYAEILRGRVYARWLLGEPLDRLELRRVAKHFVNWCLTKAEDRKRFEDSLTMSVYLQSARAAIIAADLDNSAMLLRTTHAFRWHHASERQLWATMIDQYPELTDEFDAEFERFFDCVRDPDFMPMGEVAPIFVQRETLALETGIIREMYVVRASPHDPVDPKAVIEAVAY